MANEVEQLLIDAQRALNERGVAHRTHITGVMTDLGAAMIRYTDRMAEIAAAADKLERERQAAFSELREAWTEEVATLVLVRDMHPVLLDESERKKIEGNKDKKS